MGLLPEEIEAHYLQSVEAQRLSGEWGELENGRRVKVYALTRSGRAQLAKERRNWRKVLTAMNQVLAEET